MSAERTELNMGDRVDALIEPELLVWARTSAALTLQQAAKKLPVKSERLEGWESGHGHPTIKQLRKLASVYKRPIAVFYLPEPPKDFSPMRDFRRFSGEGQGPVSANLLWQMRLASIRRDIALDLYQTLDYEPLQPVIKASLSKDPETLGTEIRTRFGISRDRQVRFRDDGESFNWWREAIERNGVMVFQATDVETSEMRGFSISESPLSVIAINNKDSLRGRVFTMLHEFVHIAVQQSGLCDLEEDEELPPEKKNVEVFCNRVAGAVLVNKDHLLLEELVLQKGKGAKWSDEEISVLSNRYKVSQETMLRRLLILDRTTPEFYRQKRQEFEQEYAELRRHKREGFALPHIRAISNAGPSFVRLVLDGYYREAITSSDLSDFLNVKLKHLGKIEYELVRRRADVGSR